MWGRWWGGLNGIGWRGRLWVRFTKERLKVFNGMLLKGLFVFFIFLIRSEHKHSKLLPPNVPILTK